MTTASSAAGIDPPAAEALPALCAPSPVEGAEEIGLETKVRLLRLPATYPDNPAAIEAIETHRSWVFLTETRAYKLKKPVHNHLVDLRTLLARWESCHDELRLNRRLAPDVYLGVVPLTLDSNGTARIGGLGTPIEWLVEMRRLPGERMLDRRIRERTLREDEIHPVAVKLAVFYAHGAAEPMSGAEYRRHLFHEICDTQRELQLPVYGLPRDLAQQLSERQLDLLRREPELFDRRVCEGCVVEGHGDLRPQHICLEDPPVIFDCLEFSRKLRIVDAVDELAFLTLECERIGAPWVHRVLFDIYERVTGDHAPQRLIRFYTMYRACMWARLAAWRTRDLPPDQWAPWLARATEYLRLAEAHSLSS